MPTTSHYDVLEVSPKASAEVIRAAYKSLMQRHHPDKSVNGTESTPLASSIALAYEVLSDPQRRLAYDQTLAAPLPQRSPAAPAVQRPAPKGGKRWHAWYAAVLVLGILLAGGTILALSKKKTAANTTAAASAPLGQPVATRPSEQPVAVAGEGQVRTLSGFVTDLAVELPPDPSPAGVIHVLRIPSVSLRLSISEPDRWTRRIQDQRPAILAQLLATLARAQYLELIKPEGEQYLKQLVEESVRTVTGLDASSALPVAGQPGQYTQAVEALLPVSFSVQ